MSNYCSFGLDAKIGLNFELKRTKSRFRNKLIYGIEGVRRFFGKQKRLKSYVERVEILNYIYSTIDLKQKSHLGSMYNDERIIQAVEVIKKANRNANKSQEKKSKK